MAEVHKGRWTVKIEGGFVVFLIGARLEVSHPIHSDGDLGGRRGMVHMLDCLVQHPEKGLLGYEAPGLTTYIQYWRQS